MFPSSYFVVVYAFAIIAIMASLAGLASVARRAHRTTARTAPAGSNNTRFFGSQIGGQSIINYSYTARNRSLSPCFSPLTNSRSPGYALPANGL